MPNTIPPVSQDPMATMPQDKTAIPPLPGAGMTPEEMKADLDNKLSGLKSKANDVKVQASINQQNIVATKKKVLGALFDLLKKAGVDPNNLESINKFINQLNDQDPDLALLFENVFNSIGSMDSKTTYPSASQGPQLMDKFKNLSSGIMMPQNSGTTATDTSGLDLTGAGLTGPDMTGSPFPPQISPEAMQ